jgi:hypothetical protein
MTEVNESNSPQDGQASIDEADVDPSAEHRTSASGRLPNDPGPQATGGGVDDMLEENLENQRPGAKLSRSEAEYNKLANQ